MALFLSWGRVVGVAAIVLASGGAWAQEDSAKPPPVAPAARAALAEGLRLSDLLDVARQELGPAVELSQALARARELAPKPALGLGEWSASARGAKVEVTSLILCRELQSQCEERESGSPGFCSCGPDGAGGLFFEYRSSVE
jgi:hypothetical protein